METLADVAQPADPVEHEVADLLAHRVVAPGVVVGRVLLARDELLRVEQLAVRASPHLVHHRRLQVEQDGPRHVFARPRVCTPHNTKTTHFHSAP